MKERNHRKQLKDPSSSLSVINPRLAIEWHPHKNGQLTPDNISYASSKKVWWQCLKDDTHEWQARVSNRNDGRNCPYCSKRKVPPTRCLSNLNPKLFKELHPTRNANLNAENADVLNKTKVWWQCQKDKKHVWKEAINVRNFFHASCPYCITANPLVKKIDPQKSLAILNPQRAQLWHPKMNGELTPVHVLYHSRTKVWWLCPHNLSHEWEASVNTPSLRCPYCTNLETLYPELACEWYIMRNHPLKRSEATVDLVKRVWWQCRINKKHVWQASVRSRVRSPECPICLIEAHSIKKTRK